MMHKTVEAVLEADGHVRLLETVAVTSPQRALVTILESPTSAPIDETAFLSEAALAEDWNRDEENEAWKHLRPVR